VKRRTMTAIGTVAVAVTTSALAACGSGQKIGAQSVATLELRHDMNVLADAAAAHNTAAANSALTILEGAATRARADYLIDDASFARILAAVAQVRSDLTAPPSGSATAAATRSEQPQRQTPTPTVSKAQPNKSKSHGNGHGPGHGGGGDD
jgi:hypothetical protein